MKEGVKSANTMMLSLVAPLRTVLSVAKELRVGSAKRLTVNFAKNPGIYSKQNAEIFRGVYPEPKDGDSSLRSE